MWSRIDAGKIAALGAAASMGLQPYRAEAGQGLANKLFGYLSFGQAIASSLAGENGEFLTQYCCGVLYPAGDPAALVRAIAATTKNGVAMARMQNAARKSFAEAGDARATYRHCADHVEGVAGASTSGDREPIAVPGDAGGVWL